MIEGVSTRVPSWELLNRVASPHQCRIPTIISKAMILDKARDEGDRCMQVQTISKNSAYCRRCSLLLLQAFRKSMDPLVEINIFHQSTCNDGRHKNISFGTVLILCSSRHLLELLRIVDVFNTLNYLHRRLHIHHLEGRLDRRLPFQLSPA